MLTLKDIKAGNFYKAIAREKGFTWVFEAIQDATPKGSRSAFIGTFNNPELSKIYCSTECSFDMNLHWDFCEPTELELRFLKKIITPEQYLTEFRRELEEKDLYEIL